MCDLTRAECRSSAAPVMPRSASRQWSSHSTFEPIDLPCGYVPRPSEGRCTAVCPPEAVPATRRCTSPTSSRRRGCHPVTGCRRNGSWPSNSGVSRATLAQALVALEMQGRVAVRHGDGAVILDPAERVAAVVAALVGYTEESLESARLPVIAGLLAAATLAPLHARAVPEPHPGAGRTARRGVARGACRRRGQSARRSRHRAGAGGCPDPGLCRDGPTRPDRSRRRRRSCRVRCWSARPERAPVRTCRALSRRCPHCGQRRAVGLT